MADDEHVKVDLERYERFREGYTQVIAEDWFPVIRHDEEPVEARPVDRQNDIHEGERTESDQWLIREDTGETYTVSNEVFEERYAEQRSLRTECFAMDLSWDEQAVGEAMGEEIEMAGMEIVAEVSALIDVRTQSVVSFKMINVSLAQDNWQDMDGIPVELLYDSPMFNRMKDIEREEDDE